MAKRIEHIFDDNGQELKRCSSCKEWLPLENFNQSKTTWDKLYSNCKICSSKISRQYHKNNPEKHNEGTRKWRENNPEYQRQWKENNPDYDRDFIANKRATNIEYRHKNQIRSLTLYAIKQGKLVKPDVCELCGYPSDRIQAHHVSYDVADVLNVTFLCVACHVSVHQQLKLENPMFEDDDLGEEETTDLIADNEELQNHLDLIAAIDFYDSDCGHA